MSEGHYGLRFRIMETEDACAAARLEAGCSREPWTQKAYMEALENKNAVYAAAWLDGEMVGCCGFWQSFETADICNVAVAAKCRGQGIAQRMLLFLMTLAKERQVREFTLEVRAGNTAAIALYQKLGFQTEGVRRNFYGNPQEDALIMWKR